MTELRVFYERREASGCSDDEVVDVFEWLEKCYPATLSSFSISQLRKQSAELRPDDYIDLGCPHFGLKLRGGFGPEQQSIELKTRVSKDPATGKLNKNKYITAKYATTGIIVAILISF